MTDPLSAARALIEPLDGYTPEPWEANINDKYGFIMVPLSGWDGGFKPADARLMAAAPDLRDMVATLAEALEAERAANVRACAHLAAVLTEHVAKVAAAYETAACVIDDPGNGVDSVLAQQLCCDGHMCGCQGATISDYLQHIIRALTPANAQAALDKMLAEARLEGWRAGREAAAAEAALYGCSEGADEYTEGIQEGYTEAVTQIVDGIRALPEPKETSHG